MQQLGLALAFLLTSNHAQLTGINHIGEDFIYFNYIQNNRRHYAMVDCVSKGWTTIGANPQYHPLVTESDRKLLSQLCKDVDDD